MLSSNGLYNETYHSTQVVVSTMQRNLLLFLAGCVPVRVGLIVGSYFIEQSSSDTLKYIAVVLAGLVAMGFFHADVTESERGFFGSRRYWNSAIHGILYVLYAVMLAVGTEVGYIVLVVDLVYGIGTVFSHYWFTIELN